MQLHPKGKIFVVDAKIKEKMDKRSLNSRKKRIILKYLSKRNNKKHHGITVTQYSANKCELT